MAKPLTTAQHWQKNIRLTALLLGIWFISTFGIAFYARELNQFTLFGFPLGFYMGAQGSILINVVIIAIYARYMNRLDRQAGVPVDEDA